MPPTIQRGNFLLHKNADGSLQPVIEYSLPKRAVLDGEVTRQLDGAPVAAEAYRVKDAELNVPKKVIGPNFLSTDYDAAEDEPVLWLALPPKTDNLCGTFTVEQGYVQGGSKPVFSEYYVKFLEAADADDRILTIPRYGLQLEWSNPLKGHFAYLSAIAGYSIEYGTEMTENGNPLELVSGSYLHIVVVGRERRPASGWPTMKLTLDLGAAAEQFGVHLGQDRSNWNFYRHDITSGENITVVKKIPNGVWNEARTVFTVAPTVAMPLAPLGDYFLCRPASNRLTGTMRAGDYQ
jgi:hypothetical protein